MYKLYSVAEKSLLIKEIIWEMENKRKANNFSIDKSCSACGYCNEKLLPLKKY